MLFSCAKRISGSETRHGGASVANGHLEVANCKKNVNKSDTPSRPAQDGRKHWIIPPL